MASPQLENGHTRIANELLDKFCSLGVSGGEFRILLFVVRKTYGFQKKLDRISLSQFEGGTTMSRSHVCLALKSLVLKQVLVKENGGYKLNKNHDEWVVLRKVPPVLRLGIPSTKASTKSSTKASTHKRNKETNTKEITSTEQSSEHTGAVINLFKDLNPSYAILFKRKPQHSAARRLLDLQGYERISRAVAFIASRKDDRYCPVVTTPIQLEEKWGQLERYGAGLKVTNQPKWKVWN